MRSRILAVACGGVLALALALQSPAIAAEPVAPPDGAKLVPAEVHRVLLVQDSPAVLLLDESRERFLLVFIDFFMANAIRMGMEPPMIDRPLTHDLIGVLLHRLGATVERVAITALRDDTYYAALTLKVNGETEEIDARPSDALAIAVRNDTPVYVNAELLEALPQGDDEAVPTPEEEAPKVRT